MKYKKIRLKYGVLHIPEDHYIDTDSFTEETDNAVVVEPAGTDMPHMIMGWIGVPDITSDVEEAVINHFSEVFPSLRKTADSSVRAIYDENHHWTNQKEWEASPHIGVFAIKERNSTSDLHGMAGIIR